MKSTDSVQQAVKDLALIRQAIDRAQHPNQTQKEKKQAHQANLIIQTISLFLAMGILLVELLMDHAATGVMMLSTQIREIGVMGLLQVGITLPLFVMCLYFVVWRSSRQGEQAFSVFVANNFAYLRSLSFIADLLVKFVVLSLLVLGGHPEWIGPMLVLFTADYLFQGRFFDFSIRTSLVLGLGCLFIAAILYVQEIHQLIWSLAVFAVVNALSIVGLVRSPKNKLSPLVTDEV